MYDSYGDGLCCNEGSGGYSLASPATTYYESDGDFGSGDSTVFTVDEFTYVFEGPGTDWFDASNWNYGSVPNSCYRGTIIIATDCNANGAEPLNEFVHLIIRNEAVLTFD
jgi:hypothetical protein